MLKHALKRLLVLLPAVWLIASVVFLLSKTVPGQAAETEMEQAVQSANSRAKSEAYQRAYRQMLHRTGQDLPLFYFRLGSAAEPDTLYRITSEADQKFLKELLYQTGDWVSVAAFYKSLQQLQQEGLIFQSKNSDHPEIREQIKRLWEQPEITNLQKELAQLKKLPSVAGDPKLNQLVLAAEQRCAQMLENANPVKNLQPKLFWYGFKNQYHRWFTNLLQGNLGVSSRDARPVSEIIGEAFAVTWWLALVSFALVAVLAPQIAMVLSRKSSLAWRPVVLNALYTLESIPLFIVALLLLAFSSYAGWLYDFPEEVSRILVIVCLVLVNLPYLTGQAYAAAQSALQENYVLTARAKGLPDKLVLRKHVLRNSLLPVITLLSDFLPALLAGTVMLEVIFSVPGMGRLLVNSVLTRDYEVITGIVLLVGTLKMVSHLLADLLYAIADPRINR